MHLTNHLIPLIDQTYESFYMISGIELYGRMCTLSQKRILIE